ncbi:MAG: GyrI-like domain-containing protein [Methanobrevibacter sp.]|jgi:effector-binding domain-containing protein|nr:GyrI-like domain-containing protein [Methanobrevibacter sp.]
MDEIKEKKVEDTKMAIINYKGNVKDMGVLIAQLTTWAEVEGVEITGPPFSIYYTSPKLVEEDEMIYDMGVPVNDSTPTTGHHENKDKIQVVELLEHTVVYTIHKGPYTTLEETYKKLAEFTIKYNYDIIGSPKEIYFNSPLEVEESELVTEVQFPVIKM